MRQIKEPQSKNHGPNKTSSTDVEKGQRETSMTMQAPMQTAAGSATTHGRMRQHVKIQDKSEAST